MQAFDVELRVTPRMRRQAGRSSPVSADQLGLRVAELVGSASISRVLLVRSRRTKCLRLGSVYAMIEATNHRRICPRIRADISETISFSLSAVCRGGTYPTRGGEHIRRTAPSLTCRLLRSGFDLAPNAG